MASQPMPLFYNGLEPLSSELHSNYRVRRQDRAPFLSHQHAVPVTVDEFSLVQRHMPIVFTVGDDAVPIALMGLNEGVNVFIDAEGKLRDTNFYVPAYVRRYPYMLARLRQDAQELSLCFDPTADSIGPFEDGEPLFTDGQPSEATKAILKAGLLPLLYAHLFSLSLMRDVFAKQVRLGLTPVPPAPAASPNIFDKQG